MPDEWTRSGGAIGSTADFVASMQRFRDAGADEIAVYGSTPIQKANLVAAWRQHTDGKRA